MLNSSLVIVTIIMLLETPDSQLIRILPLLKLVLNRFIMLVKILSSV